MTIEEQLEKLVTEIYVKDELARKLEKDIRKIRGERNELGNQLSQLVYTSHDTENLQHEIPFQFLIGSLLVEVDSDGEAQPTIEKLPLIKTN